MVTEASDRAGGAPGAAPGGRGLFRRPRRGAAGPRRDIARASRFVALMKLVLPALAVALVGLVFAWPNLLPDQAQFRLGSTKVDRHYIDGLRMDNPRYVGVDEETRPYQIAAAAAAQDGTASDIVRLDLPRADLLISGDSWVALQAADGIYDKAAQTLFLTGGVTVFHDGGYQFGTETATIDLEAGSASGDDPVQGQGMAGAVEGEGFRLLDRGQRVIFVGRSRLVVYPRQLDGAGK